MQRRHLIALTALSATPLAWSQTPPAAPAAPTVRLRGTIEKVEGSQLTIKERNGDIITLAMVDKMPVVEVLPIKMDQIKVGSFIGTAAMPQADGSQLALEVLVFPEAARGSNEGHYPWDLAPQSTMTNATVADLASAPNGNSLKLKYKDGEKTVVVPPNVPIVTFGAPDPSLLVPGARVLVTAQNRDGKPTALRVLAGRNGFAPPM